MGITPITDASGLMDLTALQGVTPVQPVNTGSDFKTIWSDQAANTASKADNLSTYVSKNNAASDSQKTETSDDTTVRNSSNDRVSTEKTDRSQEDDEASKTDVKGKESPDEAGETEAEETAKAGGVLKDEEIVSAQEVLSAQVIELVQKITEILGITPEEFENIIQESGIDDVQLLDKDVLSEVLVQALGADSNLDLLTDETNYDLFTGSMEVLNEVLGSDSGIEDLTIGELKEVISQTLSAEPAEETLPQQSEESVKTEFVPETSEPVLEIKAENTEDKPKTVRYEKDSNGDFIRVDVSESGKQVGEESLVTKAVKPEEQQTGRNFGERKEGGTEEHMMNPGPSFEEIKIQPEAPVQEVPFTYSANTQEIAEQILDHMKTVTDGDYTDVEMQLHPASLGTLHIHVTNNAGVLTASFVTENEAVRSAVESQMVRLIEQFESQGIKIDAVEVTVASHAFEQGNDTGRSNESNDHNPRRSRRINLADYADGADASDLEDDEKIAAEMMAANGNTVDFMA